MKQKASSCYYFKYCLQRNCLGANLISQVFMLTDENMSAAYRDQVKYLKTLKIFFIDVHLARRRST